jgi:hypothetical protein
MKRDYIPEGPLIRDEIKRSVFEAWVDTLGFEDEKMDFMYDAYRTGFNCHAADSTIEFANGEGIDCADRGIYSLGELCGEEEE